MFEWLPSGVELSREVSAAAWFVDRLRPRGLDQLRTFIPSGFDAYVRIFHPAGYRRSEVGDPEPAGIRWGELCRDRGVSLDSGVTFRDVSGLGPEDANLDRLAPMAGTLPPKTCEQLVAVLEPETADGTSWFGLWDGNGFFWSTAHGSGLPASASAEERERDRSQARRQDEMLRRFPRVDTGRRRYFLCQGFLRAACSFLGTIGCAPNLWWSPDQAWVVVTEIDSYSTYVGSSLRVAGNILTSSDIEAIEVGLDSVIDPGAS